MDSAGWPQERGPQDPNVALAPHLAAALLGLTLY